MPAALRIGGVPLGGRPRIVAAGGEDEVEALAGADAAELVELRADLFAEPRPETIARALDRLHRAGRPVILTVRAEAEGGRAMPEAQRMAIYETCLPRADAVDVEIGSAEPLASVLEQARAAARTVLLSAHFDHTPPIGALLGLVARAETLGADLTKLVTTARVDDDLRVLLEVVLAARPRPLAAFAMGARGAGSRVLFGIAGSLLTYGSVGRPTAPGQLDVVELRRWIDRFHPE